jgi:hypothetical protein
MLSKIAAFGCRRPVVLFQGLEPESEPNRAVLQGPAMSIHWQDAPSVICLSKLAEIESRHEGVQTQVLLKCDS